MFIASDKNVVGTLATYCVWHRRKMQKKKFSGNGIQFYIFSRKVALVLQHVEYHEKTFKKQC